MCFVLHVICRVSCVARVRRVCGGREGGEGGEGGGEREEYEGGKKAGENGARDHVHTCTPHHVCNQQSRTNLLPLYRRPSWMTMSPGESVVEQGTGARHVCIISSETMRREWRARHGQCKRQGRARTKEARQHAPHHDQVSPQHDALRDVPRDPDAAIGHDGHTGYRGAVHDRPCLHASGPGATHKPTHAHVFTVNMPADSHTGPHM